VMQHIHHMCAADARRIVKSAFWNPRSFKSSIRSAACFSCPPWCEHDRARRAGFTHAGSWPTATRSEHSVHLYARWSRFEMRGMLNGQPVTQ